MNINTDEVISKIISITMNNDKKENFHWKRIKVVSFFDLNFHLDDSYY